MLVILLSLNLTNSCASSLVGRTRQLRFGMLSLVPSSILLRVMRHLFTLCARMTKKTSRLKIARHNQIMPFSFQTSSIFSRGALEAEEEFREEKEIERSSYRLALPADGYEWKEYGQKFIKNVSKFRYDFEQTYVEM